MAYDLLHLPQPPYTQVYNSRGTYTWNKPQGITMVSFFVVGGGGGGGRGGANSAILGVFGAGGGGGGAVTKLIIPAIFIPESLFINVGAGGGTSTAGGASFIDVAGGTNVFKESSQNDRILTDMIKEATIFDNRLKKVGLAIDIK